MGLRTELCDRLGIELPIISSGMGGVAGPTLVAEVSGAGGLGVLAGLNLAPDTLRGGIAAVRAQTDRPFGVNLWLHEDLRPPRDPASLDEDLVAAVQTKLNELRAEVGVALVPTGTRPPAMPDLVGEAIEVILQEQPAVFSVGLGDPGADLVERFHARGIAVMAMVTTVEDARHLAAQGVDIVVAQGGEAGGHRSTWRKQGRDDNQIGTLALVPAVVDALAATGPDRPAVVAAGGIADGRGVVAALALGAQGVLLGTRFIATRESEAATFWKEALIEEVGRATTVTDAFTGYWARTLRSPMTDRYQGAPVLPSLLQVRAAADLYAAADPAAFAMHAGQSVELIRDLPGAAEVVARIASEAEATLSALGG
jgi:nitronate monooxygenase